MGVKAEQHLLYAQLCQRRRWKARHSAHMREKLGLESKVSLDTMLACLRALNADKKVKVNRSDSFSIFVCR